MAYVWPTIAVVLAIHDEQIAEHGGSAGLRDRGLLEAALHRPQAHIAYGGNPDIAHLAAILAHGLARSHAFVDGNKRVSAVVAELFLELNGYVLTAEDSELVATWHAMAAGQMDETTLANWIRVHLKN